MIRIVLVVRLVPPQFLVFLEAKEIHIIFFSFPIISLSHFRRFPEFILSLRHSCNIVCYTYSTYSVLTISLFLLFLLTKEKTLYIYLYLHFSIFCHENKRKKKALAKDRKKKACVHFLVIRMPVPYKFY